MNHDEIPTDRMPIIKQSDQGRDDDFDGGGIILWGATCLLLAGLLIIAAACFVKAGAT